MRIFEIQGAASSAGSTDWRDERLLSADGEDGAAISYLEMILSPTIDCNAAKRDLTTTITEQEWI